MGVPPPDEVGAPALEGLLPAPVVVLSKTSSVPLVAVVTNPAMLGLSIFHVLKVIGISASASRPLDVRSTETLNVIGCVTPCKVSSPMALALVITPSLGDEPSLIGDVKVNFAVGY